MNKHFDHRSFPEFSSSFVLLIGLLGYLAFRLFKSFSRRNSSSSAPYGSNSSYQQQNTYSNTNAGWNQQASGYGGMGASRLPQDFNADEFISGAKMAYNRLQQAWDKRDLQDIAQFATPTVMNVIQEQFAQDPHPSTTTIITLSADVLDVERNASEERVTVLFDALLRESSNQSMGTPTKEIWHFVRSTHGDNTWKLDGIQQMN